MRQNVIIYLQFSTIYIAMKNAPPPKKKHKQTE